MTNFLQTILGFREINPFLLVLRTPTDPSIAPQPQKAAGAVSLSDTAFGGPRKKEFWGKKVGWKGRERWGGESKASEPEAW